MSNVEMQANDETPQVLAYRVGQLETGLTEFKREIKADVAELSKAVGSFNKWLIGVMGTLILALVLLVINLATHAGNTVSVTPH